MPSAEPFFLRHDLHVMAIAAIILGLGGWVHHRAEARQVKTVSRERVSVRLPAQWLAEPAAGGTTVARGEDAVTRVELRVGDRPSELVTIDSSLELERGQRYGALVQRLESAPRTVAGRVWLRTEYSYAFKPSPTHAPRLATAVEYAQAIDDRLYVVTVHAPEDRVHELERAVIGTLAVR